MAEQVLADACLREGIAPDQLTIHADRGAPMTSTVVADLLADLGVWRSHSRPTVSNNNPYSEAQFKTMKYGPTYPDRFANLAEARAWVTAFVDWYNHVHRHSGLSLLTPAMVHSGTADAVVAARQVVLTAAACPPPGAFCAGAADPATRANGGVDQPAAQHGCAARRPGAAETEFLIITCLKNIDTFRVTTSLNSTVWESPMAYRCVAYNAAAGESRYGVKDCACAAAGMVATGRAAVAPWSPYERLFPAVSQTVIYIN